MDCRHVISFVYDMIAVFQNTAKKTYTLGRNCMSYRRLRSSESKTRLAFEPVVDRRFKQPGWRLIAGAQVSMRIYIIVYRPDLTA
jgi:hypothetical protein